ncbi:uncharacterized protein PHACADRAFT_254849, partial [Phanerochaete carnosa HHB-10118-sp]
MYLIPKIQSARLVDISNFLRHDSFFRRATPSISCIWEPVVACTRDDLLQHPKPPPHLVALYEDRLVSLWHCRIGIGSIHHVALSLSLHRRTSHTARVRCARAHPRNTSGVTFDRDT